MTNRTRMMLTLLPMVALAGCGENGGGGLTDAGSESLGKQVVEAAAKVPADAVHPNLVRPRRPLNLSDVAIVDYWNWVSDPELAEELATYARGEFPGTVVDCDPDRGNRTDRNCYPFATVGTSFQTATGVTVPPDGILIFLFSERDRYLAGVPMVLAKHYYPGTREGVPYLRVASYYVELKRLDGGWMVGEARYVCCH